MNWVEIMLEFKMINTEKSGRTSAEAILQAKGETNSGNQEPKKLSEDVISEERAEKLEVRKIILGSQ